MIRQQKVMKMIEIGINYQIMTNNKILRLWIKVWII